MAFELGSSVRAASARSGRKRSSPDDLIGLGRKQRLAEIRKDAWYDAQQQVNKLCEGCSGGHQPSHSPWLVRKHPGVRKWLCEICFLSVPERY
jgi:hypothetical protein